MTVPTNYTFDFDPTYGLGIAELRAIRPPEGPPNFDEFWRARYATALGVDPQPRLSSSASQHMKWQVQDILYTSTDDFPIGGWLLLPREGTVKRGLVVGHGYGGRDQPDFDIPVEDTAVLFPCFRGLSRSRRLPIPSEPEGHVLYRIGSADRYVLGGCVEDLWLAVSVLTQLFPQIDRRIGYIGASFGGGIGALAIPFDKRIDRGHLIVPTFGNMPVWLSLPTTGSGHSVQTYRKTHTGVLNMLRLFDAATAAARIEIPMLVAAALFDPAVAPPCQFSIANALSTSNCHEIFILDAGHFDYAGSEEQHALLNEKIRQLFGAT